MKFIPFTSVLIGLWISAGCSAESMTDIINLVQQGRVEEANAILDQWQAENRKEDGILFLKGLLAREADEAEGYYTTLIKTHPASEYAPKALFRIAQLKYAQGLYQSALGLFSHIKITDDPGSVLAQESRYWAGLCHLALAQPDSAIIQFGRVITEFPVREISYLAGRELKLLNVPVNLPEQGANPSAGTPSHVETEAQKTAPDAGTKAHEESTAQKAASEAGLSEPALSCYRFTIQVGAYSNEKNALAQKSRFEKEGYRVALRKKAHDGRTLFMIWVGAYQDEKTARESAGAIEKKMNVKTTLISDIR